jgi:hypothetical protein
MTVSQLFIQNSGFKLQGIPMCKLAHFDFRVNKHDCIVKDIEFHELLQFFNYFSHD